MNKKVKVIGTILACLALTGTCLAAPHGGHHGGRNAAPMHHGAPAHHPAPHHHRNPPPPPAPPPAPAPVVIHEAPAHTGVIALGAALIGGLIGGIVGH